MVGLAFRCVNVAEDVVPGLCLQYEVENLRGAQILIEDAEWRVVGDKKVYAFRNVFIGNSCVSRYGADRYATEIFNGVLQDSNAGFLELFDDFIGLLKVKREFMIAGDEDFPFAGLRCEPFYEIIVFAALQVVFHCISGADEDVRVLRHLQGSMGAVGVGEGENIMSFVNHRIGSL